ncbi:MAG: HAMP domain-containing sensor histidine kinase [Eubacterium sp.]|nr:HAMP domain-containing sensor histidine kinase [Eubacterium sp.]
MKKKKKRHIHIFGKTTLIKKLLAFYLVIVVVSFYFMLAVGRTFIYDQVLEETASSLSGAADRLIQTTLAEQEYTSKTLQKLRPSFDVAAKAANCQLLILEENGDIILDTEASVKKPYYNVLQHGQSEFLHQEVNYDFSIGGYLSTSCLCITKPLRHTDKFHGYLIFAHSNSFITSRADFYYSILLTVYYIVIGLLLLTYIGLFFFCFIPLKKLRAGSKDFAIGRDNPPIIIRSNDEYGEMAETLNVLGQELSKFDEYQRKFLSSISHDFRSPLTSIHGYLQAFKDGVIPPEEADRYYDILIAETDRLTKLTNQIIDLNSYDKDNILLDIQPFDIHATIRKVTDALDGRAIKRDIRFHIELATEGPLIVRGDADKIHQVLFNLTENALKFSDDGALITIRTSIKKNKVFTSVRDTGIGIPKDELNSIWDRFYKSDLSRGKDKSGTGLGLSICKEIMMAHKEMIDVISTEGAGSTFTIRLPLESM